MGRNDENGMRIGHSNYFVSQILIGNGTEYVVQTIIFNDDRFKHEGTAIILRDQDSGYFYEILETFINDFLNN